MSGKKGTHGSFVSCEVRLQKVYNSKQPPEKIIPLIFCVEVHVEALFIKKSKSICKIKFTSVLISARRDSTTLSRGFKWANNKANISALFSNIFISLSEKRLQY